MPDMIQQGALQSVLGATPPQSLGVQGQSTQDQSMMKQNLDDKFSKMENEYRRYNSNRIVATNKKEEERVLALRQALKLLQQAGIDPNDPQQIQDFMDKLAERNPDLLAIFENAMNILLGGEPQDQQTGAQEGQQMPQQQTDQMQQPMQPQM